MIIALRTIFGMLLAAALPASAFAQAADLPVVSLTVGQVQGRLLPAPGGAVFKGIPYAAPPIGALRWRETQPLKAWKGVLSAAEYRAGCGQIPPDEPSATEDCLYLNVWTPQWPAAAKRPVMLWINGGELFGGSGSLKPGAESLVRHGVVLISLNYRGTLLGMMGHPELTAESPHHSSANYTLFDVIAALKWTRDNIARFGGDPGKVTVFSQSGGAHIASMLLTAPLAKGLIHRVILASGAPMQSVRPYLTLRELEQIGIVTAQVMNAPATDAIKYLRERPAAEIVAAMPAVRARLLAMDGKAYDEGTDGYVIPRSPAEVWAAHKEAPVPMVIGSNSQDTGIAVGQKAPLEHSASPETAFAWQKGILDVFHANEPDLLERAMQNYGLRSGPNQISTYLPFGTAVQQMGVDLNHRCGVALSAALHSAIAPTWQFEFTRMTADHPPSHGAELRYIFGLDELTDESDRKYSDVMQRYWTNFAKTGDPNGPGLPVWSKYDVTQKQSLEFATEGPTPKSAVRAVACGPYIEKYTRNPKLLSTGEHLLLRVSAPGGR